MFKYKMGNNKKITVFFIALLFLFNIFFVPNSLSADDDSVDLIIHSVSCPGTIYEDEELTINLKIKNQGSINVSEGTTIQVGLFLDDDITPVIFNSTSNGLDVGEICFVNLSWIPDVGDGNQHVLNFIVNYDLNPGIDEDQIGNNVFSQVVFFIEKKTSLELTNIDILDDPAVNKTVNVVANVKNNGADTDFPITVVLNVSGEGEVETVVVNDVLIRDSSFGFSFNWTPLSHGSHTLNVTVFYEGDLHDSMEKIVIVNVTRLQWWDTSWHYRYYLLVEDNGIVFKSQIFENDSIMIVEYSADGEIVKIVDNFYFNESSDFDPLYNARGTLVWDATGSSDLKFYYVYFDVLGNSGNRVGLVENEDLVASVEVEYTGNAEGWWADIQQPTYGSFCLISESINISVSTSAKVEEVDAFIYLKNNESHNFTVSLINGDENILWENVFLFDEQGNWTINITSRDFAGFINLSSIDFYVGKPDLHLINLSITTDWFSSSVVYINDTVNVTACITSYYANIENVKVSFFVDSFQNTTIPVVFKDKNNYVSFSWSPNKTGIYSINVSVDPDDIVDESDETNNRIIEKEIVNEWPDLDIKNIILPSENSTEYDAVPIKIIIVNNGGKAEDYLLNLYIKRYWPFGDNTLDFSDTYLKSNVSISIEAGASKTVTVFWDSASPGEWLIGAKIVTPAGKKDSNMINDQMVSIPRLYVKAIETNKPAISNVFARPGLQEQGGTVSISADITDDSGIELVMISITTPGDVLYDEYIMMRTNYDMFRYDFDNTLEVGVYNFTIVAIDISLKSNSESYNGDFTIVADNTKPVLQFYDVTPNVQKKSGNVTISCIVSDNIGIKKVTVTISPPTGPPLIRDMEEINDGEYVYKDVYDVVGVYSFYITVIDIAGNNINSNGQIFWITNDINDKDNDGMPDSWEEKHGFNPEDPNDANQDVDGDGFTNLEEYQHGTNPSKDIFMENAELRLKENSVYLTGSILIFILVLILSIIGIRRKRP